IAKKVVEDILEYGNVQKGMLGISAPRVNTPYAIENGLDEIEGVYIGDVEEESGADDAGLAEGDVIKQIDDIKIRRFADLTGYISTKRPGDKVQVTVERKGESKVIPVTLKERQSLIVPVMGLSVKNLTEKDKKLYKVKKGVKITGVPEIYRRDGLELVDNIILEVDGEPIEDIQDARIEFGKISRRGKTVITLLNKDGERERLIFQ
ncbi:S1C family serine protease, partial [Muriicola sp.]